MFRRGVLLVCLLPLGAVAQVTIWGEEFENGCATGCYATAYTTGPNGAWTVTNTGALGTCPNAWFVSCAENGTAVGACGTGCGNNETLHIASEKPGTCFAPLGCAACPAGDCGAAYDGGCSPANCVGPFGLCVLLCAGNPCNSVLTDKRADSPTINLTGITGMTLTFKYIENGEASNDNATLWYFDGAAWSLLADMPKTLVCPSGQGRWASYSTPLPASANNNPNVRIGFRWVNNNDAVGADPSIAVDDIEITIPYSPPGTGLIVNELSNGPTGAKEYIELIVVGPSCTNVDIRGIKVDDNNGTIHNGFGTTLTGSGVSAGHIRFGNVAAWSAVPTGSIILLYNNTDLNTLLPPDDPTDTSPNDKRYILPINHASMEGCSTSPNAISMSGYFTCAWGAGNWNYVGFRNTGDAGQTRDVLGRYFHGISYGPSNTANNMNTGGLDLLRISTLDHTARVLFFNSGNYRLAANFTSAVVAGNETPGAPNNAANAGFIATIDCSLPIELFHFDAAALDDRVRVEWSTASERDNDYFAVERSSDALHYEVIGTVPGGENSTLLRRYIFDDPQPVPGLTYYRLRQVDLDGSSSLSDAAAVEWKPQVSFSATLDAEGELIIRNAKGPGSWSVRDPLGRLVTEGALNDGPELRVVLPAMPPSPLLLTVSDAGRPRTVVLTIVGGAYSR